MGEHQERGLPQAAKFGRAPHYLSIHLSIWLFVIRPLLFKPARLAQVFLCLLFLAFVRYNLSS